MAEETWLTHAAPRITELSFANALTETSGRIFVGNNEIGAIWSMLLSYGVDPSYALGQFWTESLYGTAGWNIWSEPPMRSWGNILWSNCQMKDRAGVTSYAASNGYTYASYPNWTTGVEDYCLLLAQYATQHDDSRYGDTATIYGATAKWMGKLPGSEDHLRYLDVVLGRMDRYDSRPPFEGEMLINSGTQPDIQYTTNKRYAIKAGDRWYLKPGGSASYAFRKDGTAIFEGQVMGTSWFAIRVMTTRFSNDGSMKPVIGFAPNFDAKKVTTV